MADDQDFDQTQALFLDEFEQEIDEDNVSDNKNSVAFLKVSCQKSFPENSFPLYEGNNVVGRHEESCNVCIPLKGLSREHACIEIKGESFLIYDKNSRNKTKRNQLYLSPDVRYELKNGDTLMFGDVTCKFYIGNKDVDAGSETGSESEYQTANDVKDVTVEFEEDNDSDNSVDLLQPTQIYFEMKMDPNGIDRFGKDSVVKTEMAQRFLKQGNFAASELKGTRFGVNEYFEIVKNHCGHS
ncbi:MDC1 [Mytilus coruscus]|uniref:MDC1 n=1 Tax=Mytilus coruscus TaxID=42192 RepID=A0A6J8CIG6_MYTCO|nr:MDC1 [Mytilus coruscus]